MTLELFAKVDYLSIQFCRHISCLSLAILGTVVPYSGAVLMKTPPKGLTDLRRRGLRRWCLSFPTQYANIAAFRKELSVYRMATNAYNEFLLQEIEDVLCVVRCINHLHGKFHFGSIPTNSFHIHCTVFFFCCCFLPSLNTTELFT